MNRYRLFTLSLLPVVIGCSAGTEPERQLLRSWGDTIIVPGYVDFQNRAADLVDAVDALCAAPDQGALDAARAAWSDARAPWKRNEVFAFGPYSDEPLRIAPKVDFWPVRVENIEAVLYGTGELSAETADLMGGAEKGFPVIEYLLFQPNSLDLVTTYPRQCDYLGTIARDLALRAEMMAQGWSGDDQGAGGYLMQLTEAGRANSEFPTLAAGVGEIVNRMAHTVENIRVDKLGRPVGTSTGGSPQPDQVESPFSDRSLDDIRDNLAGIEILYYGAPQDPASQPGDEPLGLAWLIDRRGLDFDDAMRARLDEARAALDAIPGALDTAVVNQPATVEAAIEALTPLQTLIQVDIISALSLPATFNDNDGD